MEILDSKSQQVEINNNSDNDKAPECPDAEQEGKYFHFKV